MHPPDRLQGVDGARDHRLERRLRPRDVRRSAIYRRRHRHCRVAQQRGVRRSLVVGDAPSPLARLAPVFMLLAFDVLAAPAIIIN